LIERIDVSPVLGSKSDVDGCQRWSAIGLLDFEQATIADIEGPEHVLLPEGQCVSQGCEGSFVKEPALCEVAYSDGDMVNQAWHSL
jgi:hypothetical protein